MRLVYLLDEFRVRWNTRVRGKPARPSRRLIDMVGGGDFDAVGQKLFRHLTQFGGLGPGDRILDIGCGCGRVAVPMMGYLEGGSYFGFDVSKSAIDWCRKHITAKDARFEFAAVDIRNKYYNPKGRIEPGAVRFPYPDGSFDLAFATSVFTHLLPAAVELYLRETARVLAPGGRLFATFFLLNDETRAALRERRQGLSFRHDRPDHACEDADRPELAVAYPEPQIRERLERHGFRLGAPIRFGAWRKSEADLIDLAYQDIILAVKNR
ncbi:MAG: methyltransferase domain-containing protein [Opitutaceae bacterium]